MEYLDPPPSPSWVRVKGVPLHVWDEEVFRLVGNCLGRTAEIDGYTSSMVNLQEGRIKVLLNKTLSLPCSVLIWVNDLKFSISIEVKGEEQEFVCTMASGYGIGRNCKNERRRGGRLGRKTMMSVCLISIFKKFALDFWGWIGRL